MKFIVLLVFFEKDDKVSKKRFQKSTNNSLTGRVNNMIFNEQGLGIIKAHNFNKNLRFQIQ